MRKGHVDDCAGIDGSTIDGMRKGHVDDCAGIDGSTIDGMRKGHVDDCAGIGVLLNAQYAFAYSFMGYYHGI